MAEVEKGGSPHGALEPVRNTHLEHPQAHSEDYELDRRQGNPFSDCIAGEKPPYTHQVFDRVNEKLIQMMGDYPTQNWYWTRLDPEDRKDMLMVYIGFSTGTSASN